MSITSAWAVVHEDQILIDTISSTERAAKVNYLVAIRHIPIYGHFSDEDIAKLFEMKRGSDKIEQITCEVGKSAVSYTQYETEIAAKNTLLNESIQAHRHALRPITMGDVTKTVPLPRTGREILQGVNAEMERRKQEAGL